MPTLSGRRIPRPGRRSWRKGDSFAEILHNRSIVSHPRQAPPILRPSGNRPSRKLKPRRSQRGRHDRPKLALRPAGADGSPKKFAGLASPLEPDAFQHIGLARLRFRCALHSKQRDGTEDHRRQRSRRRASRDDGQCRELSAPSRRHSLRAPARRLRAFSCGRRRLAPSAPSLGADVHAGQHWPLAAAFSRRRSSFVAFGSKDRREPISRRPFRTRLWRRSCGPCFPCRRAAIARH